MAIIASCSSLRSVNTSVLKIGMTKAEVEEALKKKPYGTISAKSYPETKTVIEVLEYNEHFNGQKSDGYWLYFVNGKLDKWEPASKYHQPDI
ncbi:hypothetical protein [Mucilaginibacter terrae]|uniref:DUF2845 domain-containing protein n=1 Tax=Mucilaginibacter terrae TaxID=1955052 RepID=A0ABU3GXD0_9SPHI|nr:hypothetical protein [Mucilaginibacter terrae]MDT3404423.1 hypothetical protein [Mucilaginibacter terrae]